MIRKSELDRVRAIEDTADGAKIRTNIFDTNQQTFEPIRELLGIRLGDSPFISKRQIIVEGPSDYYFLTAIAEYYSSVLGRKILDFDEVAVMPAGGANEVPDKAVLLATQDIDYAMVLDSDEEGREVYEEIKSRYHRLENGPERAVLLSSDDYDDGIVIEDLFDTEFYLQCFNETYSNLVDGFSDVEYEQTEDGSWEIEDHEYDGRKITEVLEQILSERGIHDDLAKVRVANTIQSKLNQSQVTQSDVEQFQDLLVSLRQIHE